MYLVNIEKKGSRKARKSGKFNHIKHIKHPPIRSESHVTKYGDLGNLGNNYVHGTIRVIFRQKTKDIASFFLFLFIVRLDIARLIIYYLQDKVHIRLFETWIPQVI